MKNGKNCLAQLEGESLHNRMRLGKFGLGRLKRRRVLCVRKKLFLFETVVGRSKITSAEPSPTR